MKLSNATLRPARVIEVLKNGNIKVEAPGMFSGEDKDLLPPVMPFLCAHPNAVTTPTIGMEVWLLSVSDNPRQLFWFRKDDPTTNNTNIPAGTHVEVISNHRSGMGFATIYFEDGSGWVITNGGSSINISHDGTITLDAGVPHSVIQVGSSGISLGSKGQSSHPGTYGDKVEEAFGILSSTLNAVQQAASTNVYTKPIAIALEKVADRLDAVAGAISSPNVTLD